jgi:hypothetical protein
VRVRLRGPDKNGGPLERASKQRRYFLSLRDALDPVDVALDLAPTTPKVLPALSQRSLPAPLETPEVPGAAVAARVRLHGVGQRVTKLDSRAQLDQQDALSLATGRVEPRGCRLESTARGPSRLAGSILPCARGRRG